MRDDVSDKVIVLMRVGPGSKAEIDIAFKVFLMLDI